MDESTVTITIQERNYSLRVAAGDVETLQSAARKLDELATNFARQFPGKDHQDHIAMAALLHEVQLVKLQQRTGFPSESIERRLQQIEKHLDQALANDPRPLESA